MEKLGKIKEFWGIWQNFGQKFRKKWKKSENFDKN
jgi:hypothetical protein